MKKKWLLGFITGVMILTFCAGLSACIDPDFAGSGSTKSDDEIAQTVINMLNSLYLKDGKAKDYDSATDFQRLGQIIVENKAYAIEWTADVKTQGYSENVKVGTEMDSEAKVTINIARATVDIEYTLTASVTVNKTTKTASYKHKIPAKSSENSDTASLSFETTDARVSQTGAQQVWQANGITVTNLQGTGSEIKDYFNPVRWYKNSIVRIEFPNLIHVDFHSKQNYADSDQYLTRIADALKKVYTDATVTVDEENNIVGIQLANPVSALEFTCTEGQCQVYSIDVEGLSGELTDAQKVAAAKVSVSLAQTLFFEQNTIALVTESNGAKIAWAFEETTTNATIENGTLKITTLPTAETKLTLVATITSGEESDTAEFEITLKPQPTLTHAGTQDDPFSAEDVITIAKLLPSGSFYMKDGANAKIYVKGYIIAGTWSTNYGNFDGMYIADDPTSTIASADALQIFGLKTDDEFITEQALPVGATVTILGGIQNYSGKAEISLQPTTVALEDNRTPEAQLIAALGTLKDITVTKTGEVELAASFGNVTFAWALKTGETLPEGTAFADGKLTVTTLPAADTTVKFVVTAKLTGATDKTKEVSVTIKAEGAATEGFTPITAPAAGSDYYLAMDIKGTWYYSTGKMAGYYLGSTTDISQAAKVTVAVSGNGWTLVTNGKYIEIEVGEHNNIVLKDSQTAGKVWDWDADHAVFTMTVGSDSFFMGTYGDYTTFNAAYASYLNNENEYIGKIGTYTGTVTPPTPSEEVKLPDGDVKLDFSSVTEKGTEITSGDATDYFKGFTESADLTAAAVTEKVYKGNGTGGGDYENAGGMLKLGTSKVGATITLTFAKNVTKVVIMAQGWPGKSDTLAVNDGTAQTMSGSEKALYTFELTAPAKEIKITSNVRAFIFGIVVTFDGGSTPSKTDAEKLADAKAALKLSKTELTAVDEEVELPAKQGEASVAYALQGTTDLVKIENGKLIVLKLPEADTEITVKATLTVGEETATVDLKVTVKAKGEEPADPGIKDEDGTVTFNVGNYAAANGWVDGNEAGAPNYNEVDFGENVTVTISTDSSSSSLNTGKYYKASSAAASWRLYQNENASLTFTAGEGYEIVSVKITYNSNNSGILAKGEKQYASGDVIEVNAASVTFTVAQKTVDSKANGQVRMTEIVLVYKATGSTVDPDPTPDPDLGNADFGSVTTEFPTTSIPQLKEKVPNANDTTTESFYVLGAVKSFEDSSYYCNFHIYDAEGNDLYVYGLYKEDGSAIIDITTAKTLFDVDDIVVLYGTLKNYKGTAQIVNAWLVQVNNEAKTDVAKVLLAGIKLTTPVTEDFNLPTLDGKVSWAVTSGTGIKIENNVAKVTRSGADQTVVLTATATVGSKTATKAFTIVVSLQKEGYEEVVLTAATLLPDLSSAYGNSGNATIGGYAFSWIGMGNYGLLQMRTNSGTGTSSFWNTEAFKENISKVVFTWAAGKSLPTKQDVLKVEFANDATFTDAVSKTISFSKAKYELTVEGEYKYVRITHNNNGAVYLDEVKIICEAKSASAAASFVPVVLPGKQY